MTLVVAVYHFLLAHGLSQASNFTVPSFASKISTTFFPNYNFNLWQQTLSALISYMSLIYIQNTEFKERRNFTDVLLHLGMIGASERLFLRCSLSKCVGVPDFRFQSGKAKI